MFRIAPLFGSVAFAQDDYKIEATVDCSYVHANPQNNTMNAGEEPGKRAQQTGQGMGSATLSIATVDVKGEGL